MITRWGWRNAQKLRSTDIPWLAIHRSKVSE